MPIPETKTFTLELTKDELAILHYVRSDYENSGEPLKDTYEMDDEPEDPMAVLKTLNAKIDALAWEVRPLG